MPGHWSEAVAHDLRAPLSRLRSRIEQARRGPFEEQVWRATLDALAADVDVLVATCNALLDIARAQTGEPLRDIQPVDLSELVAEVAEVYAALADERGIAFVVEIETGVSMLGVQRLLAQAIANLLDNALKFTPTGGRVGLRLRHAEQGWQLQIDDSGPGIPEAERERVFERFVRLPATEALPGHGLGLALVRAVVRAHGIQLRLGDQVSGSGLCVLLSFPAPA